MSHKKIQISSDKSTTLKFIFLCKKFKVKFFVIQVLVFYFEGAKYVQNLQLHHKLDLYMSSIFLFKLIPHSSPKKLTVNFELDSFFQLILKNLSFLTMIRKIWRFVILQRNNHFIFLQ